MKRGIQIWRITEHAENRAQELIMLATSAAEALEIVGEAPERYVVGVERIGFLAQLPGEKYRAVEVKQVKKGRTP